MNDFFTTALLQILFTGVFLLFISFPVIANATDTLKVKAAGVGNRVVVGTRTTIDSTTGIPTGRVKGRVVQSGQNNRVEIHSRHSGLESVEAGGLKDSTITSGQVKQVQAGHKILIKQSGENNSVKINTN